MELYAENINKSVQVFHRVNTLRTLAILDSTELWWLKTETRPLNRELYRPAH